MEQRFHRSFASLEGVFRFADGFLERERIDARHRFAVRFAIEEMFTNLVKFHPGNPHEILIRLERDGSRLTVTLTDFDVDRFDPTEAPRPRTDAPLEEREVGGLGIHLTRRLMDEIAYEYADRRSTITLTKRLE